MKTIRFLGIVLSLTLGVLLIEYFLEAVFG
jgi:hypothetical protein